MRGKLYHIIFQQNLLNSGVFEYRPDIYHFFSTNVLLGSIFLHMKARKFCIYGDVFYILFCYFGYRGIVLN